MEFGLELAGTGEDGEKKALRDIWSAGQGVGSIHGPLKGADLIETIRNEYLAANAAKQAHSVSLAT